MIGVIAVIIAVILVAAVIFSSGGDSSGSGSSIRFEEPHETAGRYGEWAASSIIRSVLREGDILLTNVSITFEGRDAEFDNIIVNKYGVFIIEVKNYSGKLVGGEEDFLWQKFHTTAAGNVYVKEVKNPIRQVRRQIYILAHYLEYYGTRVWVEGYTYLLAGNSPVISRQVLSNSSEIDRALHTPGRNRLTVQDVHSIANLLEA